MIANLFLNLFDVFINLVSAIFSGVDFTVNYNTLGSAIHYVRMALWFLPLTDILLIFGIKIVLINYMTFVRLILFVKNLLK